ncbi:MAG: glycosyltransferase family 2 protein [Steroidobacteraceae bacterium]
MPGICAVIPVYEHGHSVGRVVSAIRAQGLACLLVDDGSGADCARALGALAASDPAIELLRLPVNRGKGAAVQAGLLAASGRGCGHVLQIDADGQHSLADIPRFLAECRSHPEAVICGRPVFGSETPGSRLFWRHLTRFWVWVNTLSFDIPDAMCGFRIYPLRPVTVLLQQARLGRRMDFDIEILVRLHWAGVPMRWLDTRISYPAGGTSHFRMWLDNVLITRVHTLLFFGMLWRSPRLVFRRRAGSGG